MLVQVIIALMFKNGFSGLSLIMSAWWPSVLILGVWKLDLPKIPFAKAFEDRVQYSLQSVLIPSFVWKTMKFFNLWKEMRIKEAIRIVHEFVNMTVKNRKADMISRPESSKNN
ncbi:hypothetical protein Nepgr_022605 [Nepenthes gracilis]|uniref:Uncharacterized protein n=1 Tax=Nepenthes gracilis TaxID=150966 RepID=A0AAD3SZ58_NEPGR|nr:hypothetical protein Nepgr_022605 [Nepenthes gracilis]